MTLMEYMRTHKGEEGYDEITVHDTDYDTEIYFYPEDPEDEKWDKAMHRLAEALTVIDIDRDKVCGAPVVTVDLSKLIESKISRINEEELFTSEVSVGWLMDRIHLILAGNVTEDWFADYFVPVLVGEGVMKMNEVQEKKCRFVRSELLRLIQAIDRDILSAEYQLDGGNEYVEVKWLFQSGMRYRRRINVTADSPLALTKDVLKCLD